MTHSAVESFWIKLIEPNFAISISQYKVFTHPLTQAFRWYVSCRRHWLQSPTIFWFELCKDTWGKPMSCFRHMLFSVRVLKLQAPEFRSNVGNILILPLNSSYVSLQPFAEISLSYSQCSPTSYLRQSPNIRNRTDANSCKYGDDEIQIGRVDLPSALPERCFFQGEWFDSKARHVKFWRPIQNAPFIPIPNTPVPYLFSLSYKHPSSFPPHIRVHVGCVEPGSNLVRRLCLQLQATAPDTNRLFLSVLLYAPQLIASDSIARQEMNWEELDGLSSLLAKCGQLDRQVDSP